MDYVLRKTNRRENWQRLKIKKSIEDLNIEKLKIRKLMLENIVINLTTCFVFIVERLINVKWKMKNLDRKRKRYLWRFKVWQALFKRTERHFKYVKNFLKAKD